MTSGYHRVVWYWNVSRKTLDSVNWEAGLYVGCTSCRFQQIDIWGVSCLYLRWFVVCFDSFMNRFLWSLLLSCWVKAPSLGENFTFPLRFHEGQVCKNSCFCVLNKQKYFLFQGRYSCRKLYCINMNGVNKCNYFSVVILLWIISVVFSKSRAFLLWNLVESMVFSRGLLVPRFKFRVIWRLQWFLF